MEQFNVTVWSRDGLRPVEIKAPLPTNLLVDIPDEPREPFAGNALMEHTRRAVENA